MPAILELPSRATAPMQLAASYANTSRSRRPRDIGGRQAPAMLLALLGTFACSTSSEAPRESPPIYTVLWPDAGLPGATAPCVIDAGPLPNEKPDLAAPEECSSELPASPIICATTLADPLPEPRALPGAVVAKGYAYVVGGLRTQQDALGTDTVWYARLDSEGAPRGWHETTRFPRHVAFPKLVVHHDFIYVIGGLSPTSPSSISDEVFFAPVLDEGRLGGWTELEPLPTPATNGAVVVMGDTLYVLGGIYPLYSSYFDALNYCADAFIQGSTFNADGSLGPWALKGFMAEARGGFGAVTRDDKLLVVGSGSQRCDVRSVSVAVKKSDGSFTGWARSTSIPVTGDALGVTSDPLSAALLGDQVFAIGAQNILSASLRADGSVGRWKHVASFGADGGKNGRGIAVTESSIIGFGSALPSDAVEVLQAPNGVPVCP